MAHWQPLLWGTLPNYREAHYCGAHQSWGRPAAIRAGGSSFPCPGNPHSSYHQSSSLEADFLSRSQCNGIGLNGRYVIECCIACLCAYIEVNLLSVRLHRPKVTWGNTLRECTGWQMVHRALCNPQIFIFEMPSTSYQQTWPQIPPLQTQD